MTSPFHQKRVLAVAALSFHAGGFDVTVVRKINGRTSASQPVSIPLSGDPAKADPQTIGLEIRQKLDALAIRERKCVVGLPPGWMLSFQSQVPDLPEEDLADFLDLEAERGFAYPPEELAICRSRFTPPGGAPHVTQIAVPRENIDRMEQILRAAKLAPVSFSLDLGAFQASPENAAPGLLHLALNQDSLGLVALIDQGIAVFRTLSLSPSGDGQGSNLSAETLTRELRITLGQLEPEVRATLRGLNVVGGGVDGDRVVRELGEKGGAWGLKILRGGLIPAFGLDPGGLATTPVMLLAARYLAGARTDLEFLPPRLSAWKQFTERYSSKKLLYTGAVAGAVALLVAGAFLIQQFQLARLRGQWSAMKTRVQEVEAMQQEIKRFRPWYDDSLRSLCILRRLTEAFPEDSAVTAKSVEIHEGGLVVCAGTARDHAALLRTLDRLRATQEVTEVTVDQLRGKAPLQFTFNFRWAAASAKL